MSPRLRESLRLKVLLVILLTSAVALAAACAAFIAYQYSSVRSRSVVRLGALAAVIGENCRAALAFGDRRDAAATLAALEADPRILAAAVYSADGDLFASWRRRSTSAPLPAAAPADGAAFATGRLALTRPIAGDRSHLGTLHLVADLRAFEDQFHDFGRAVAAVLVLALLIAGLLAYRLQRVVADPVLRLVEATRAVATHRDYAVRVAPTSGDELGLLAGSFNHMLEQIERRDTALRDSEERYATAVRGARDGLWDWRLARGEIYFAPRWLEMLGYGEGELPARPEEWLDRIHPDDAAAVRAALDAHLAGATPHFLAEYRLRHRDGGYRWVVSRGLALRDAAGRAVRLAGSQSDVTESKGRDPLTGLPNRILLVDRLERALGRRPPAHFAVLAIELERLPLVNETLGRSAGRDLLRAAAERIQALLSSADTLARLDGPGFAVLVEELRGDDDGGCIAARIHAALAPAFRLGDQEVFNSAAIGIALSDSGYQQPEDMLRDAHAALSRARDRGWGSSEVFDQAIRARAVARLELEDALRRAVERGELELHYQPIVALDGKRLAGFEALTRWPRGGAVVLPEEFIGLAERSGLIVPLGHWVLREACRQLRAWRDRRPWTAGLTLSVNVSALQLCRRELVGEVESALRDAGLPPACLKLEITESALVEQLDPAARLLHELERVGVGVWLDDFGTGYSSLSYLHRFPIEAMKIDRSFVGELGGRRSRRREIVETMISLARQLGMKAIAEGVETQPQLRRLEAFGCDFAQGYALSGPLAAAEVEDFLARQVA